MSQSNSFPPRKPQSNNNFGLLIVGGVLLLLVGMHLYRGTKFAPAQEWIPSTPLDSTVNELSGGKRK